MSDRQNTIVMYYTCLVLVGCKIFGYICDKGNINKTVYTVLMVGFLHSHLVYAVMQSKFLIYGIELHK